MWVKAKDQLPPNQDLSRSRRRYMAYDPKYGGYIFRCWYKNGFGATGPQSMLFDVTHYRPAKKSEYDRQLTESEIEELKTG